MGTTPTDSLNHSLVWQLDWHWTNQLRPRFDGLTDEEYLWEPVDECWSVRPRGSSDAPVQAGTGDWTIDFAFPEPEPAPVTTIAWRRWGSKYRTPRDCGAASYPRSARSARAVELIRSSDSRRAYIALR